MRKNRQKIRFLVEFFAFFVIQYLPIYLSNNIISLPKNRKNPIFTSLKASQNNEIYVNTIDPLAQGGTAWSKVKFLDAAAEKLLK